MASHSSASTREETSHATETSTLKLNRTSTDNINEAIKRRAQSIINNRAIDPESRAVIRYGLEINDPWLPELVRRVDAGENISDFLSGSTLQTTEEKISALTDLICRAGDEPETKSAALLVLMATIENAAHPKALANTAGERAANIPMSLNIDLGQRFFQ